jgi:hypothetical protein
MADRTDPPPGYTVENVGGPAGWVIRNPDRQAIGLGWSSRTKAVHIAWDAADALARAARNLLPGWFAAAGDRQIGGPFDSRTEAGQHLARYVDDGTFRVVYGRRGRDWTFTELPVPDGENR